MKIKKIFSLAVFLALSNPALAHHGEAKYGTGEITVNGTVTKFQFLNPHAEVYFEAKDNKGNIEQWIGEASSPNMLVRDGWNRDSIKPGDRISASGHPAKDGSNSIFLEKLVMSDGRQLAPHPRWP